MPEGKMIVRVACFFLTITTVFPLSFCQEPSQEPTYEQTRKWVVSKISDEGGYTIHSSRSPPAVSAINIKTSYEQVSMGDCVLKFTEVVFNSGMTKPSISTSVVTVPLDKVTSLKIVQSPPQFDKAVAITISTSGNMITSKVIEKEGENVVSQDIPAPKNIWPIQFGRSPKTDEDTANRVMKALNHAVAICAKPKESEPF